jgi:hypothetical protein
MNKNKNVWQKFLANFTLAKFLSALITITILATIKYAISGNLYIDYCNFWTNIGVGLLGFTINTGFMGLLSDFLGINGINFNLKDLIFGFETIQMGETSIPKGFDKPKIKLCLAMESGESSNCNEPLDKGKGIESTSPPFSTGTKDFSSVVSPKTNPGPGFNVPGGEVPIRDDICKHINYNSHILNQFKKMNLETAIEQRNNNLRLIHMMNRNMGIAKDTLAKIPLIPTNDFEFELKEQLLQDLKNFNETKIKAEGRTTLLNSRIEFIESKRENK